MSNSSYEKRSWEWRLRAIEQCVFAGNPDRVAAKVSVRRINRHLNEERERAEGRLEGILKNREQEQEQSGNNLERRTVWPVWLE